MSTRTRLTTIAALATLAAGAFALPAAADDARPPIPEPADAEARAELCARIPAARDRIAERLAALEADDDPGSPERLGARIGRAEGKGRDGAVRMLEHRAERRAERRADRLERLQENLERLSDAESAYCPGQ